MDGFPGVFWNKFSAQFSVSLQKAGILANFIDVQGAMISLEKIDELIAPFLGGDDPLFGFRFPENLMIFLILRFFDHFSLIPITRSTSSMAAVHR